MKKKLKFLSCGVFVFSLALTSCDFPAFFDSASDDVSSSSTYGSQSSTEDSNGDMTYGDFSSGSSLSLYGKMSETQDIEVMPSLGSPRIFVAKVEFKDSDDDLGGFDSSSYQNSYTGSVFHADWDDVIYDGFFGDDSDTGWQSVRSFYKESSYGKLNIEGTLADTVYVTPKTLSQYESSGTSVEVITSDIAEGVYEEFFGGSGTVYNGRDYDSDGDGVIDGLWLVYDLPYDASESDLLWAFTSWHVDDSGYIDTTGFSTYGWASKWFFTDGEYLDSDNDLLADSHTFIHETGHFMGLLDMYDTSSTQKGRSPAGALIMMDHNVYDQDPYSKYMLGWIDPRRISVNDLTGDSASLTLEPFEESGDALIVDLPDNTGWEGEEYLLVIYWTPTGLNEKDASEEYEDEATNYGLTESGMMVFHVDSRFMEYGYSAIGNNFVSTGDFASSATDIDEAWEDRGKTTSTVYTSAYDNSSDVDNLTTNVNDVLLLMIDASNNYANMTRGENYTTAGTADNDYLFREGDKYDDSYLGYKSQSGFTEKFHTSTSSDPLGLSLTFGTQDSNGAEITFDKD